MQSTEDSADSLSTRITAVSNYGPKRITGMTPHLLAASYALLTGTAVCYGFSLAVAEPPFTRLGPSVAAGWLVLRSQGPGVQQNV